MTYKLTDIYNEVVTEKLSDDPHKYYKHLPKIAKLLRVEVKDFIKSGTRSSVFELTDGKVLKLTNDIDDAAGLRYSMIKHPELPVLKVYEVYKYVVGMDAYKNPMYVYIAITEKLDILSVTKIGDRIIEILKWFAINTKLKPKDLHQQNIGISKDKSTPLGGLVILDPSFNGMRDISDIPELK